MRLDVEGLEDRVVPTALDLSTFPGQSGTINGAIFTGVVGKLVGGSGSLDSFVRLSNTGIEQGYNTDARPYQTSPVTNDAGNTASFDRAIQLSALPMVQKNGIVYYEFVLDANQNNKSPGMWQT
jgi:hypothetical protein